MTDQGGDAGELPAYRGMGEFVDALEQLIKQPRRRRSWLPVLLLTGPVDGRVATGLRRWLNGDHGPLTPHAYVSGAESGPEAPDLFDEISEQLRRTTRACDGGRLRLPGLWLLRTVAAAPEPIRSGHWRGMRDHLYARHREESTLAQALWNVAGEERGDGIRGDGGIAAAVWNFLVGWAFQGLPRLLFTARAKRRLAWFTAWADRQRGPASLFDHLRDLVPAASSAEGLEDLDRVLVQAMMTDLERAVRGGFPRPWRRRRAHRYVLLFDRAGDEHSRVQRFIRELRNEAKDRGATSLLVVAAGVNGLASLIPDEEKTGFDAAADWLVDGLTDPRLVATVTGLVVTVPEDQAPDDPRAAYQLRRRRRLRVRPHRLGPRAELAAELTAVALLAGLLPFVPLPGDDGCAGGTFRGSDGTCVGPQGPTLGSPVVPDPDIREVLGRIEEQNAAVDAATADWRPEDGLPMPRTVFYIGPLSGGAGSDDPVRGGTLAQLRGLALAQGHGNAQALGTRERVPLRVVAADAGDRFRDAVQVARHVVDLAEEDPSIVGVVGMAQSRDTVYRALEVLSRAGLPVVGMAGTADELLDHGTHYYQNAPTNSRAAVAMAAFATDAPMIADADGRRRPAERAVLVADARDAYSSGLAGSFQESYPGPLDTLLYTPSNDLPRDEGTLTGEPAPTLARLAAEVCGRLAEEPATALVWAARGSELPLFLQELRVRSEDCPRVSVLGGDEISNVRITEDEPWRVFPELSLYYVLDGGGPMLRESQEGQAFADAYERAYGGTDAADVARAIALDPRPALAWDALRYFATAVDQAWESTGRANGRLDRDLVQGVLYQGLGPDGFDGATGRLDPAGADGGGRTTEDKLVIILHVAAAQPPRAELVCGAVTAADVRTTWGEGNHPCP
ncbi:ABC transporter substrate-binding protein [Streptomyces millisiae]|uniref:ABC transporter substrate-binding protein n=1 Tax=Streptomyces millisiae TaxID=3075542 RepID=A0ABU2LPI2_9ACTN|nr:ABC transporter substrate-binding protein [Streptomyces sp. DSM 44918]MDT0319480.1 ABC transporter substrate-binding protein [Streptomyces sp. DSM 44918]